jgi:hypothetical protein
MHDFGAEFVRFAAAHQKVGNTLKRIEAEQILVSVRAFDGFLVV